MPSNEKPPLRNIRTKGRSARFYCCSTEIQQQSGDNILSRLLKRQSIPPPTSRLYHNVAHKQVNKLTRKKKKKIVYEQLTTPTRTINKPSSRVEARHDLSHVLLLDPVLHRIASFRHHVVQLLSLRPGKLSQHVVRQRGRIRRCTKTRT